MAGQIAISLLILVAAGLFVRTLSNLESVNLGFNRQNLLLFELNGRQSGHRDGEINDFYNHLTERFAAIPGVASAGLAGGSMISGEDQMPISLPGSQPDINNRYLTVGPRFLTTMQVPILVGRDIDEHDRTRSQPVAVVNERFAKINFHGENPLGRHLLLWGVNGAIARDMEIVGVAKNASYGNLKREIPPVIYMPFNQGHPLPHEMMFALRTTGYPLAYVPTVRQNLHQADPRLPLSHVRTEQAEVDDQVRQETILADLGSAFAVLALTIAGVGLYGTISYAVARRTGEIGIRMALERNVAQCFGWCCAKCWCCAGRIRNQRADRDGDFAIHRILPVRDEAQRSSGPGPAVTILRASGAVGRRLTGEAGIPYRPHDGPAT